jgi:Kdo2-lipid IVA lauroyltransferase/acyltransferase
MKFRHYIEFGFVAVIRLLLWLMPRRAAVWFGRRLGDLFYAVDVRHRKLVLHNLDIAYKDELDAGEKRRIARGSYRHFGGVFCDLLRSTWLSKEQIDRISVTEGWENLEAAEARGKGVLILTAHFGFWEMMGVAQGFHGKKLHVLARALDNPLLDKVLRNYRSRSGNVVLYKANAVKAILEILKDKGMAAVLIDQNVNPNRGIFVDFFGVPACTTTVVSALAVRTGAPIVPAFSIPEPGGRWRFIYDKPLEFGEEDRGKERIAEITQQCTTIIEDYIRRKPEAWLWMHRRWKTRPPEECSETEGSFYQV